MKTREEYNAYMREYHLKRYYRIRGEIIVLLGGKCARCPKKTNLQIDHVDPSKKEIEVSRFLSVSKKVLDKELKKCQLLCQKHHSLKTTLESGKVPSDGNHGSLACYSHRKCRCKKCRDAWSLHSKNYKRRKKEERLLSSMAEPLICNQ